jgi:hypothetical protein
MFPSKGLYRFGSSQALRIRQRGLTRNSSTWPQTRSTNRRMKRARTGRGAAPRPGLWLSWRRRINRLLRTGRCTRPGRRRAGQRLCHRHQGSALAEWIEPDNDQAGASGRVFGALGCTGIREPSNPVSRGGRLIARASAPSPGGGAMFRVSHRGEGIDDADTLEGARRIVRGQPPGRYDVDEISSVPCRRVTLSGLGGAR